MYSMRRRKDDLPRFARLGADTRTNNPRTIPTDVLRYGTPVLVQGRKQLRPALFGSTDSGARCGGTRMVWKRQEPRRESGRQSFPQTDWTALEKLKTVRGADELESLNVLASRYWVPLYRFLRAQGAGEDNAKDLVQGFFAFALKTCLFQKADRGKGRFRNYLLRSLKHFVANAQRECTETGRRSHFVLFHQRVVAPALEGAALGSLEEQAAQHGLGYKEAANQIVAAKRAFRRLLVEEVRYYACSEEDVALGKEDVLQILRLEGPA